MRPLFNIIGLGGSIMMIMGMIGLGTSQSWGYRQLMIGLMATSTAGLCVAAEKLAGDS